MNAFYHPQLHQVVIILTLKLEWTCLIEDYNDGHICDCSCGAYDPDCDLAKVPIKNCIIGTSLFRFRI